MVRLWMHGIAEQQADHYQLPSSRGKHLFLSFSIEISVSSFNSLLRVYNTSEVGGLRLNEQYTCSYYAKLSCCLKWNSEMRPDTSHYLLFVVAEDHYSRLI